MNATLRGRLEHGVIGDLVFELHELAEAEARARPGGVFEYARWCALGELASYFEEEQGIPTQLLETIDERTRGPLVGLLNGDGRLESRPQSEAALASLIEALAELRS